MEGRLYKWTNVVKGWQYRWFILDRRSRLLTYYTTKEKMLRDVRRGCLRLKGAVVAIDDEEGNTFNITSDSKTVHLQAKDAQERENWVTSLQESILESAYDQESPSALQLESLLIASTVQDFDKKLEEADAYVKLMAQNINSLREKLNSDISNESKLKYECIIKNAESAMEEMKRSIVLLTVAKDNKSEKYEQLDLVNNQKALVEDVRSGCSTPQNSVDGTEASTSSVEDFYDAASSENNDPKSRAPTAEESFNQNWNFFQNEFPEQDNSQNLGIPEITYEENNEQESQKELVEIKPSDYDKSKYSFYFKSDGTIDYDALYDDSQESVVSVENQGSVIAHLLSQVKIGMDLTKVALPTFILETRSLLEMYADHFSHPEMFVRIPDLQTEKERMVQVVRWYICSFHSGKKSSTAKKPYNPVLGETFQCYWNIPGEAAEDHSRSTEDGPLPWCPPGHLCFVAEQVSHHPPLSAFYAEHFNKQISFNAFIWTKSKFLGLSIGVNNVGRGVVDVIKYGEQYVVTFPHGYGRSILTVPWIELGGSVTISCEKSGYNATLEFLTKPFYGGKKHRICGSVFAPGENAPFLKLSGQWNGVIEAKWSDGRIEQFADVDKLTITKKIVRPIEKQDELESRNLWKEVTAGLKMNNVQRATLAKCDIEQKKRLEEQERKELGIPWQTKLFNLANEGSWIYNKALPQRLDANKTSNT